MLPPRAEPAPAGGAVPSFQQTFHQRWGHLGDARVRALAWLLDAPGLLDPAAPAWQGQIASTGPVTPQLAHWLEQLDHDPAPLAAALGARVDTRLGLYAEKLMAFYFRHQGLLVAHGLQIRASRNDTVGEFDFLLDAGAQGLAHIEFATKFYLLQGEAGSAMPALDAFVGPNLADSLGAKMRKIFSRQLALGSHPAAQALLARPVCSARALVKGWLFYPDGHWPALRGLTAGHCRGFWCALDELAARPRAHYLVLPKLAWLAPYRTPYRTPYQPGQAGQAGETAEAVLDGAALEARLHAQFARNPSPALVAVLEQNGAVLEEVDRGFIVSNDWRARAQARSAAPDMANIVW